MKTEFESYMPEAWYVDGLLSGGKQHGPIKPTAEKRSSSWKMSVRVNGLVAGILGVTLIAGTATATNIPAMFAGVVVTQEEPTKTDPALSPLREINRSFNELFASFNVGERLIPSDEIRRLADTAVRKRDEEIDIDAWADSLSRDVKDARD